MVEPHCDVLGAAVAVLVLYEEAVDCAADKLATGVLVLERML